MDAGAELSLEAFARFRARIGASDQIDSRVGAKAWQHQGEGAAKASDAELQDCSMHIWSGSHRVMRCGFGDRAEN